MHSRKQQPTDNPGERLGCLSDHKELRTTESLNSNKGTPLKGCGKEVGDKTFGLSDLVARTHYLFILTFRTYILVRMFVYSCSFEKVNSP